MARLAETHVALRKAIEAGRPHAAYRALFWMRLLGKAGQDAALVRQLLGTRRLFIQPLNGAPSMMTYNGIGARPYGSAEPDLEDGSHILTLYLVIVYVPVYPFSSYLVRSAPSGGWTFFGKVPLSSFCYLWQRGLGLMGLAAVLFGAFNALGAMRYNTVQVVNALPFAVAVKVGAASPVTVASKQIEKVRSKVGVQDIVVQHGAEVIERGKLEVKRGYDVDAWNVLGAAPLYRDDVVYTAEHSTAPKPKQDDAQFFCGEQSVLQDGVDYAFEKPPDSISMGEHEDVAHRSRVALAEYSPLFCLYHLAHQGKLPDAKGLVRALAQATDYEFGLMQGLYAFSKAQDDTKAGLELVDVGRKHHDGMLEYHRMYQSEALAQGHRTEVVAEYRARAQAHPDSADDAYLLGRVLSGAEAERFVTAAVTRYPRHPYLLRTAAFRALWRGDFAEVERLVDVLHPIDARLWQDTLEVELHALAAMGKIPKARELVTVYLTDSALHMSDRSQMVVNADLLGHFDPLVSAGPLLASLHGETDEDSTELRFNARLNGGETVTADELKVIEDDDVRARLELVLLTRTDPKSALSRIADMEGQGTTLDVAPAVWLLLLAEAVRLDEHHPALARLVRWSPYGAAAAAALVSYVQKGTVGDELEDIQPDVLAAADFVRSRNFAPGSPEYRALRSRVTREDALHGIATHAMMAWPQ